MEAEKTQDDGDSEASQEGNTYEYPGVDTSYPLYHTPDYNLDMDAFKMFPKVYFKYHIKKPTGMKD
jgi:hypothetical protein